MDVQGIGKESVTAGTGAENREEYRENSGRNLNEATEKELQALKLWLFSENIRIQGEQKKTAGDRKPSTERADAVPGGDENPESEGDGGETASETGRTVF